MSHRKKVMLALLGSLLFHLVVILSFSWWWSIHPPPKPVKKELSELTILPPDPVPLTTAIRPPPKTQEKINVRSDNMIEAEKPPVATPFESDRDTMGASERAGRGPSNLPSVAGRNADSLQLTDQELSLGSGDRATGPKAQSNRQALPDMARLTTPQPTQPPRPRATPPPVTNPEAVPLVRATPTPRPTARPDIARTPGGGGSYRPQTRATRIEGSLSNRGRPSIAARGTPMGRYLRQVETAIGSRWYIYIRRDPSILAAGSVRIMFCITRQGKIQNMKRMSNSSNESFASLCEQAILFAELPPIPDDVAQTLYTGRIELPFTFTYQ